MTFDESMIDLLGSSGPAVEHRDELMLFGQFVGAWDIDATYWNADGSERARRRGEWQFGWVLEGRAIQDVLISPPLEERLRTGPAADEYGTTVRIHDPRTGLWYATWFAPVAGGVVNLVGRAEGTDVVLEGAGAGGRLERWTFSEITDDSFLWQGRVSDDCGGTWWLEEEMRARRRT